MKRKITCIGLATLMFAIMASYIMGLKDLLDSDGGIVYTIVFTTMYCMGITGTALLGAILWLLAFATGDEITETEEIEA